VLLIAQAISVSLLSVPGSAAHAADAGALRVGAAKIDITPPASMFPLSPGRKLLDLKTGKMVDRLWTAAHDPIYVRALVIANGNQEIAIVTYDVGGVPGEADTLARITAATGIPADHIWLADTSNHSAPQVGRSATGPGGPPPNEQSRKILELWVSSAVDAVRRAKATLQPARMGYGAGASYININRDMKQGDQYVIGYNPDRPAEKKVDVLKFVDMSGQPIAVLINYALTAVVMYGAVSKDEGIEVTGDIPGATSQYVESHYKDKVVALWTAGATGDLNPQYMTMFNQSTMTGPREGSVDLGASGYALMYVQGTRLGEEVVRVSDLIHPDTKPVAIGTGKTSAMCPGWRIKRDPATGKAITEDAPPVELKLQAITLNDVALVAVHGEAGTMISQHFKKVSPFSKSIMLTHVADSITYIPDDASYPLYTPEVFASPLKPGCAENAIVNGLVKLLKSTAGSK
jgi:hypothetical protein